MPYEFRPIFFIEIYACLIFEMYSVHHGADAKTFGNYFPAKHDSVAKASPPILPVENNKSIFTGFLCIVHIF